VLARPTVFPPEPELPRPPPDRHRRALPSVGSPSPGTHLAHSLGLLVAPPFTFARAKLPARRSNTSSGARRRPPPWPPVGTGPATSKHLDRDPVNPRPSPAASPAKTAGELAGFRPAAPPLCLKGYIARPQKLPGCFVQTEGRSVKVRNFPRVF
jgi:hypothetical protein